MSAKIKILFHTSPNLSSFNAQDINGRYIASYMDANKFHIYFIMSDKGEIDPKIIKDNITIYYLSNYSKLKKWAYHFYYKMIKHYDYSFYIRVYKSENLFLKIVKFTDKTRKKIHMIESMLPYLGGEKYNKYAKFNAINSDFVVSISNHVKETVKSIYSLDTNIINAGVDTSIFKPLKDKKNSTNCRVKVISCGTLTPLKNPLLLVRLAKIFTEVDFTWVGEGALFKDIVYESKGLKNFLLLNNVSHNELAKYFNESDIFVFPSLHEGFPKVVIESMACGIPTIVFDVYGPESVIDGETGFIVSNESQAIDRLKQLVDDNELRKKLGLNAAIKAKEYDWTIIVSRWEKLLLGNYIAK